MTECHAEMNEVVVVGEVSTVHVDIQFVLTVPSIKMECGRCGFGRARLQAPMLEVSMEQHHVLVKGTFHISSALVCRKNG